MSVALMDLNHVSLVPNKIAILSYSSRPNTIFAEVVTLDDISSPFDRVIMGTLTIVWMQIKHRITERVGTLLMIIRVLFPWKEVNSIIDVGVSGATAASINGSYLVDKFPQIGNGLFRIFQQA